MRRVRYNLTVQPPDDRPHIAYERDMRVWLGFVNQEAVLETASEDVEQTRRVLDAYTARQTKKAA